VKQSTQASTQLTQWKQRMQERNGTSAANAGDATIKTKE